MIAFTVILTLLLSLHIVSGSSNAKIFKIFSGCQCSSRSLRPASRVELPSYVSDRANDIRAGAITLRFITAGSEFSRVRHLIGTVLPDKFHMGPNGDLDLTFDHVDLCRPNNAGGIHIPPWSTSFQLRA